MMVTLITEQLRKQSLEEPYHKAFSFNSTVSLPAVGSSPTISWSESSTIQAHPSSDFCIFDSTRSPSHSQPPQQRAGAGETVQSSPPPPPKRHCRSLSVPEDLSRCRSTWHPSASKVWTPVKHGCHSGGAASSVPLCGPSSSFTSSIHSSSSPTFFSLALSSDSLLSWSFPWEPPDAPNTAASLALPSSCSSSPAPLVSHSVLQRCFSLSPVHIQNASVASSHPQPSPSGFSGVEQPGLSPSPTSACSTPSSSRRGLPPALPRCHSQPCDMRRPRLKRRRDPDVLPCPRPGLDFSKMTQISSRDSLLCGPGSCMFPVSSPAEHHLSFSPAEFLGQVSIGPLSESEEEEEEEEEEGRKPNIMDVGTKVFFERDCTELDLNLIEEN